MTAIAAELLRHGLNHVLAVYAFVVLTHFVLQVAFAHQEYRAAVRDHETRDDVERLPSVDVIVTSYNEEPERLEACLQSVVDQEYPGKVRVFVIDDDSANRRCADADLRALCAPRRLGGAACAREPRQARRAGRRLSARRG